MQLLTAGANQVGSLYAHEPFMQTATGFVMMFPYIAIALLAFLAAEWWLRLREANAGANSSGELIKSGNAALALRRFGLFIAIGIGMSGVYATGTPNFWADLLDSVEYALALVVMVMIALHLNDWIVLPNSSNSAQVVKGNLGVAATEVGSMIATGLVAKSAIAGEGGGLVATIVFFALGQIALLLSVRCYAAVNGSAKLITRAEDGNFAAGIVLGAILWAYGLVISTALAGGFISWTDDIISFAIAAAMGIVFMLLSSWVIDEYIVRWHTLAELVESKSTSSALVQAGAQLGTAFVVSTLLL